jgi:peptidoglycan/LPS O-acetylase OafA/YrhL
MTNQRLAFADGLRGFAAMWVVLFHMSEGHHLDALRARLPEIVNRVVFDWGHAGVAVFFVLSGFVMALTVSQAAMDGAGAGRFILRRLVRLAPPYWLAIVVSVAVLLAKGVPANPAQIGAHAVFLQDVLGYGEVSVVFWTLCIEIQFYVAFAAMTWLSDRLGGRGAPRVGIALLAMAWPLGLLTTPVWRGGFLPFWALFMAGVLAWEATRHRLVAVVPALLLAVGLLRHDLLTSTAAVTCLALIASNLSGGMQTWLSGRVVQFLGLVSYSLYLLHNPVTGVMFRVLHPRGAAGELAAAAATIACCLGVAWAAWATIERASIGWSRKLSPSAAKMLPA